MNARAIVATGLVALLLPAVSSAAACATLSIGSTGPSVTALQKVLFDAYQGFPSPTGYFGKITEAAVKQWQGEHGIEKTGTVGPKTRAAMKLSCVATSAATAPAPKQPSSSVQDLINTLLAQIAVLQAKIAALKGGSASSTAAIVMTGGGSGGGSGGGNSSNGGGNTTSPPTSCTFNGQTVASGAMVTAYQSASVPFGSQCVSETRTCVNGALSGSYTNASCSVQASTRITTNAQLEDVLNDNWTYQLIFSHANILPPSDMVAVDPAAHVASLYNPTVVFSKTLNQYILFSGVSVSCPSTGAAADSILWATSPDGKTFTHKGYVVEPDIRTCSTPVAQWPVTMPFEVNDPTAILVRAPDGSETVYVSYTVAAYRENDTPNSCGHIGTSVFSVGSTLELVYQNFDYLKPDTSWCQGANGEYVTVPRDVYTNPPLVLGGFSRPSYNRITAASTELWFDVAGGIYKLPVTAVNQLSTANITFPGTPFGALDNAAMTVDDFTVLYSGFGVAGKTWYTYKNTNGGSWSGLKDLTHSSGQSWDSVYQTSPEFFVNPDTCQGFMYFAGSDGTGPAGTADIGVAVPSANKLGKQQCRQLYGK